MEKTLKALIVEDSEDDAQLLLRELRRGGYAVTFERVENVEQMAAALADGDYDIVFADYSLPHFDAPGALELLKKSGRDIPFIIISGTVTEEMAVTAMKAGAHDYLQKRNLKRLFPAIDRELREAKQRAARREADEALRESEAQYRILFESNPHPMWVYDSKTLRFLAVNDAAVHHYGYSRDEFLGMTIKDIRDAEHVPALLATTSKDDAGLAETSIWQHRKKDGSVIDVEITSHGIAFGSKRAQLVLAHDVTERLRAQRQLQEKANELSSMTQQLWQASKLATMGELAASVAHELNNPLATVSLRAETLLDQLAGDESKQRSLQIIIGEVERMAKLVTNLLQFTRRNYRQVSTIDVREEVIRSLELISYYLRNRKVTVVTSFEDSLPQIHADRQQLRQVFLNVMTNASDAMPQGGTLTVHVRHEQRPATIVIEFSDTGEGIAAKDLEKVWEPFYTSKAEGKGTGLGLPICSRIIEEHGGTITLESEVGKGTTVRVALPAAVEPAVFDKKSESPRTQSVNPGKESEPQTARASKTPKAYAAAQARG
ncbi:MAG TPA: ATP-binding protein [Pyrinomonadaceae bacterium]|nr:ATP-binding protein [Pyrinomonadaceae bacterium]